MGLKCRITYDQKGKAIVTNEEGIASKLYQEALEYTGSQKEALNIWATAGTPEFISQIGKDVRRDDVALEEVVRFYNSTRSLKGRLSPSEIYEVKGLMKTAGFTKLSELSLKLKSIFQPDGTPDYDPGKAVASGLFLPEDLPNINVARISNLITRIEGELLFNDFEVEVEGSEYKYKNPLQKNILGASETISMSQIEQEVIDLIDNLNSPQEFYNKMQELPYPELTEKFYDDEVFATKFMEKFQGLYKIPVAEERDGQIMAEVTDTSSTTRNIISTDIDTLDIEADIEYITSVPQNIWRASQEEIKTVIREIEKELASKNIDIIGLHKVTNDQAAVVNILTAVKNMVGSASNTNISAFSEAYDVVFNKQPQKVIQRLTEEQSQLSIVRMYSSKSAQELFEQQGLISIGDNLYHKVNPNENVNDLYEYLYQQLVDGKIQIPYQVSTERDLENKPAVLQDLSKFINSRDTGFDFYNEKLSLYQIIYKHSVPSRSKILEDIASLSTIRTDEYYLKTDFVSDFYQYILQEKLKDSAVYRNTLSKIKITDQDISIVGAVEDLRNIKMFSELMDYFKLKKDPAVKKFIPSENTGEIIDQLAAINSPKSVAPYEGGVFKSGNLIATAPVTKDFVRVGDSVYKKIAQTPASSVFVKLANNIESPYYTTTVKELGYSEQALEAIKKQDMVQTYSEKDLNVRREKAGMFSAIVNKITEKSKEVVSKLTGTGNTVFESNLVEFLRQKGVSVITDPAAVSQALETLGINNIKQMFSFDDMKVNETMTIKFQDNVITVTPNYLSKSVRTPEAARNTNLGIYNKIRKYLKENTDTLFRENMITHTEFTTTLNIPANLKEQVEAAKRIDEEVRSIMKAEMEAEQMLDLPDGGVGFELSRGMDEETLRDLGYNMLQTPIGNILGFEHNGTIYLDQDQLNNITTLHELIHVFQTMLKKRASQGDTKAQDIITKRAELFQGLADEWVEFHKGQIGEGQSNFVMKPADTQAFEKEKSEIMSRAIEDGTYMLAPNRNQTNLTEGQWLAVRTKNFKNWFGEWETDTENASKVVDENGEPKVMYTGTSKDKEFDSFSIARNGVWFTSDPNEASMYAVENDSQDVKFDPKTGKYSDVNTKARVIPVFIRATEIADFKTKASPEKVERLRTADNYKKIQGDIFQEIYFSRPLGEKRFDAVDYNGDGNLIVVLEHSSQIKSATGNFGEYSPEKKQIHFSTLQQELGIDLSAKAYAQRPKETDVDYNTRILEEIEAYIAAPEIALKLENLKNSNPSLWERIMDFISSLNSWLKSQIGLSDYKGNISEMTMGEYVDALGVSILKDEYKDNPIMQGGWIKSGNKLRNEMTLNTMVLDSQVEALSLHTETEENDLFEKIDSCGL